MFRHEGLYPAFYAPYGSATCLRARVRLGSYSDAARRLAAFAAVGGRPARLGNYPGTPVRLVPFAVPVSARGIERDAQCHCARVHVHGAGACFAAFGAHGSPLTEARPECPTEDLPIERGSALLTPRSRPVPTEGERHEDSESAP